MLAFRKILVPHDFSEHARQATEVAADLARRFEGSLSLVHVVQPIVYAAPEGLIAYPPFDQTEILTHCEKKLAQIKEHARSLGVREVETKLLQGVPVAEIVQLAKSAGCDLIVMGTHGRTGIAHALIGSVAERVVRTAPCPVLVVPKPNPAAA